MTAIIISILAALGIGGGVMLASSGGGSSGGGAAVVAPANPGTSGGGSSYTGGGNNTGSSTGGNIGGNTGGSTGGSTGASGSSTISNIMAISKNAPVNINKNGKNLTLAIEPVAPTLDPDGNGSTEYTTNTKYGRIESKFDYITGYGAINPELAVSVNLDNISSSKDLADFYTIPKQTKVLPKLKYSYIATYFTSANSTVRDYNFTNVNWELSATLALGGRKLALKNSDFGYYKWTSRFSNEEINKNSTIRKRALRYGAQQLYMYDKSEQFIGNAQDYINKYGDTAKFTGNVIGSYYYLVASCWNSSPATDFSGTIDLYFNFKTKNLTGSVTSTKANLSLKGNIKDITSNTQNFTITDIGLSGTMPQNNTTNYGGGVLVNVDGAKDEAVGEIAYTWSEISKSTSQGALDTIEQTHYINMAFGAIQQ